MASEKAKGLFDFVNAIQADQSIEYFDNLSESELKTYRNSRYMINRVLSMNPHYSCVVNEIQKYNIPERAHYLFYTNMLPKKKQFNKYIKSVNEDKYPEWIITLVKNHFNVSISEAIEYIDIYFLHNKEELTALCQMYGVDQKDLKKVKL